MKTNQRNPLPWLLVGSLLIGSAAWAAQPVAIPNAGFEATALANGAFSAGTPPGWTAFNGGNTGVLNPSESDLTGGNAPEGQNVALLTSSAAEDGLSQTLSSAFQAGANYALTVKVVNPKSTTGFPGYRIQLLAGGTVLAEDDNSQTVAQDSVATSVINYTFNSADAGVIGQPLGIRLLSKGLMSSQEIGFDDVQLTVTLANPVAVPGGPYAVFVGGSLLLDGSGSLPSAGATITTYEWDLDNDGGFDEGITGATPAAISQEGLVANFNMALGSNTVRLRVTDSAAKSSTVETTVNILPGTAVVYEPFAYPGTALNGVSSTNEVGFAAPWTASVDTRLSSNLPYGSLLTKGAGIGNLASGQNRFGGARTVSAAALAGNGLLNDGATLWFSVIMGYDSGGNRTNSRLAFALANNSFNTTFNNYNINGGGAGSGLGVTLGRFSGANGRIVATQFTDGATGNGVGFGSNVFGTGQTTNVLPQTNTDVDSTLVVGRITWGAAEDTIDLFLPGPDMSVNLDNPHSSLTVSVDQSLYNTISFARGDRVVMDEIRFGASYASVTDTGTYWDLNGDVAGAGSATPSGTWGLASNWSTSPAGIEETGPWPPGGTAVFSAGDDATGAYTITVDNTQDVAGISFENGTATVEGGTALRLTANGSVSVTGGLTATISTPFTEDVAGREISKAGTGTLILSGNNSGVTGGMILAGGTTQFAAPSAIAGTARNITINPSGTAMFGPGFGSGNIPAALLDRIVATSSGTIAADHYGATDIDFETAGLTNVSLGAVGNVSYTGTLTPNGTIYRLGGGGGTLTFVSANAITGENSLIANGLGTVVLAEANDYTGPTTVNGGTTLRILGPTTTSSVTVNQVSGILEVGHNNALGSGTLTFGGGFGTSPSIRPLGTIVTTNPVTMAGNFNVEGTGSLTLGPITTTGGNPPFVNNTNTANPTTIAAITAAGAARPIGFSGNGATTVTGAIGGGSDVTDLLKTGNGTLTLNGVNTYTGTTTVENAGTLLVVSPGSLPAGAVTLFNTSTLAGTGTIGGNVTVTATANIAPGNNGVGTLPIAGDLTISAMAGGAGTLRYQLGPIAASDRITVGGTLTLGTNVFGFSDFQFTALPGLENGTYKLITASAITGTLLDTNLTGSIGAATGTLQITGNDIELVITNAPSGSPYGNWATGGELFGDDANGDGVANGLAFLLGAANPAANALGLLPTATAQSNGDLVLTFSMRNATNRGAASLTLQWSHDLGASDLWSSNEALVPEAGTTVNGVVFAITPGDPLNTVTARLPAAAAADGKLFFRLKGE